MPVFTDIAALLEFLASQVGLTAQQAYDANISFAELAETYLPDGYVILDTIQGNSVVIGQNTAGSFVETASGVAQAVQVEGYNAVTSTATQTIDDVINIETASGANPAATTAGGVAGLSIAGVPLYQALLSGLAVLGGVAQGVQWYNKNPEFWTNLSEALLPFAYEGVTYKDTGDNLRDALNALVPALIDGDGNTYLQADFLQKLSDETAALLTQKIDSGTVDGHTLAGSLYTYRYDVRAVSFPQPARLPEVMAVRKADGVYIGFRTDAGLSDIPGKIAFTEYMDNSLFIFASSSAWGSNIYASYYDNTGSSYGGSTAIVETTYTYQGKTVHYISWSPAEDVDELSSRVALTPEQPSLSTGQLAWLMIYGTYAKSDVDGISADPDAQTPIAGIPLSEQYPDWYADVAQTVDPSSPINDVGYVDWFPVSINNERNGDQGNTTYNQNQAQTGNNPGNTITPEANTPAWESLAEGIKDLIDALTSGGQDTQTPTGTEQDEGDSGDDIPVVTSGSSNGLWRIYNPSLGEIQSFGAWLWNNNIISQIVMMFANPMEAIIGLHLLYATPSTSGSETIKAGYLDSGVSAAVVSDQYTSIDCGTVTIPEYYRDARDYDYTKVSIYLPFIGIVDLDTYEVMGGTITCTYRVDVLTGTCLAQLKVNRRNMSAVLYTYQGNCAVQIPLSSGNYGTLLTGLLSAVGGIAASFASGGAAAPAVLGAATGLTGRATVQRSGNLGANAGAMGNRVPYIIIRRPISYEANNYNIYYGYPSNVYAVLGSLSGYTRIKEIHLDDIPCTDAERDLIDGILKAGVIL